MTVIEFLWMTSLIVIPITVVYVVRSLRSEVVQVQALRLEYTVVEAKTLELLLNEVNVFAAREWYVAEVVQSDNKFFAVLERDAQEE